MKLTRKGKLGVEIDLSVFETDELPTEMNNIVDAFINNGNGEKLDCIVLVNLKYNDILAVLNAIASIKVLSQLRRIEITSSDWQYFEADKSYEKDIENAAKRLLNNWSNLGSVSFLSKADTQSARTLLYLTRDFPNPRPVSQMPDEEFKIDRLYQIFGELIGYDTLANLPAAHEQLIELVRTKNSSGLVAFFDAPDHQEYRNLMLTDKCGVPLLLLALAHFDPDFLQLILEKTSLPETIPTLNIPGYQRGLSTFVTLCPSSIYSDNTLELANFLNVVMCQLDCNRTELLNGLGTSLDRMCCCLIVLFKHLKLKNPRYFEEKCGIRLRALCESIDRDTGTTNLMDIFRNDTNELRFAGWTTERSPDNSKLTIKGVGKVNQDTSNLDSLREFLANNKPEALKIKQLQFYKINAIWPLFLNELCRLDNLEVLSLVECNISTREVIEFLKAIQKSQPNVKLKALYIGEIKDFDFNENKEFLRELVKQIPSLTQIVVCDPRVKGMQQIEYLGGKKFSCSIVQSSFKITGDHEQQIKRVCSRLTQYDTVASLSNAKVEEVVTLQPKSPEELYNALAVIRLDCVRELVVHMDNQLNDREIYSLLFTILKTSKFDKLKRLRLSGYQSGFSLNQLIESLKSLTELEVIEIDSGESEYFFKDVKIDLKEIQSSKLKLFVVHEIHYLAKNFDTFMIQLLRTFPSLQKIIAYRKGQMGQHIKDSYQRTNQTSTVHSYGSLQSSSLARDVDLEVTGQHLTSQQMPIPQPISVEVEHQDRLEEKSATQKNDRTDGRESNDSKAAIKISDTNNVFFPHGTRHVNSNAQITMGSGASKSWDELALRFGTPLYFEDEIVAFFNEVLKQHSSTLSLIKAKDERALYMLFLERFCDLLIDPNQIIKNSQGKIRREDWSEENAATVRSQITSFTISTGCGWIRYPMIPAPSLKSKLYPMLLALPNLTEVHLDLEELNSDDLLEFVKKASYELPNLRSIHVSCLSSPLGSSASSPYEIYKEITGSTAFEHDNGLVKSSEAWSFGQRWDFRFVKKGISPASVVFK